MTPFDEHLVLLSECNTIRLFFNKYLEQFDSLEKFLSRDQAVWDYVVSFGTSGTDF